MNQVVFLDRDGVLIENRADYVRSWKDVDIFPQAIEALVQLKESPYRIVIITNQSAVGRGIITLERAEEINRRLIERISRAGGRVDGVYMCPHAPEEGCLCRKPRPGMVHQAVKELSLSLEGSFFIGDALTDMVAADRAGIEHLIMVKTGRGENQLASLAASHLADKVLIEADLGQAVKQIV
jgi:D-glycero-D-manno-heptose 1,7-bisphosphate phosphatase